MLWRRGCRNASGCKPLVRKDNSIELQLMAGSCGVPMATKIIHPAFVNGSQDSSAQGPSAQESLDATSLDTTSFDTTSLDTTSSGTTWSNGTPGANASTSAPAPETV